MTKQQRIENLLPGGKPKYVRVYDNASTENESCDHYTVVFSGRYTHKTAREHWFLTMSGAPYHPQGICQHGTSQQSIDAPEGWSPQIGRKCHLGRRIPFEQLPADCQKVVLHDYCYLWDIPDPNTGQIPKDEPVYKDGRAIGVLLI
jgi:hypothetical protein